MDHEERAVKIPIVERSVAYSVRVIRLYKSLMRDSAGRVIGHQLLRSATSVGANAHEAQAAQSRADFIAKMSIAHKEARESSYWLRLIDEAELVPTEKLAGLRDETESTRTHFVVDFSLYQGAPHAS